jgi:hypothetical protein
VNNPAESSFTQRDRDIHTRKPGTDQQNALLLSDIAQRARFPGIRNITLTVWRSSREPEIARRKVPECDHYFVCEKFPPAAKMDLCGLANTSYGDGFVLHMFDLARVTFDRLLQQRSNIPTVDRTREIIIRGGAGIMVEARPLQKVPRIIWVAAHVPCPDIQQMFVAFGAVGYAAAKARTPLNENHGNAAA